MATAVQQETMAGGPYAKSYSLRIPTDLWERIKRLRTWAFRQPELRYQRESNTSALLLYVIDKGLAAIEAEARAAGSAPSDSDS